MRCRAARFNAWEFVKALVYETCPPGIDLAAAALISRARCRRLGMMTTATVSAAAGPEAHRVGVIAHGWRDYGPRHALVRRELRLLQ